jgi:hypothetical protein
LPTSYHKGLHTKKYYDAIEKRLTVAYNDGGASAVKHELQIIATQISMGIFPYLK